MSDTRSFASDNFAPVHPKIMQAIVESNQGHAMAYGGDDYTGLARKMFNAAFGQEVAAHFVFNGTAANLLSLMAFQKNYGAVLCADCSHIANDESTAPERVLGMRLTRLPAKDGKINAEQVKTALSHDHGVHWAKPVALSITQPTELGTVYSLQELKELATAAHAHGLGVHMDGARIGAALEHLGVTLRQMVVETGIDVVSFGGTKQGLMCGEAVILLDPKRGAEFPFWQKNSMQLASKMRFIAAQFVALLEGDLWLRNARHANEMAKRLEAAAAPLNSVTIEYPVQSNAVFVRLPKHLIEPLSRHSFFWPWDPAIGLVRWMCAFDTEMSDIDGFIAALRKLGG